ncbi:MAG: hypothetical protein PHE15_05800 [Dehalococcoidales bacterium]|nr:hypothetical protein [Dehalococcoidales bacterium]
MNVCYGHHQLRSSIVNPGIGFGQTWQQDFEIVRRLKQLRWVDLLIGTSWKSLIKMV